MNQEKPRVHWIIWPALVIAVIGLVLPMIWPTQARALPTRVPPAIQASEGAPTPIAPQASPERDLPEEPITVIPLTGKLVEPSAEISGLGWYQDYLMILPQYPRRGNAGQQGYIYALRKADILDYLDGNTPGPLEPLAVPFDALGLQSEVPNFGGFESIGFSGSHVYLTIEAGRGSEMIGYLVKGEVALDLSRITIDTLHLAPIGPQAQLKNKADEALVVMGDRILTFFEVNGAGFNPAPVVHVFDLDLNPLGTQPSAALEYRLTDAAGEPGKNRFWVMNSFFLADLELLPKSDPLAAMFGKGPTHARFPMVERLVEMQYDPLKGVELSGRAPVELELAPMETRNWEGLALLEGRGFLIATDKYPSTLLAFVPLPAP